jgi:hypothetical protein
MLARIVNSLFSLPSGDAVTLCDRRIRIHSQESYHAMRSMRCGCHLPRDQDLAHAASNHSPDFFVDESALVVGVRALAMVAVNFLIKPN